MDETSPAFTWTSVHPHRWTTTEVADWLSYVAHQYKIDDDTLRIHLRLFDDIRGEHLCSMTRDDFKTLDLIHGDLYYEIFQKIFHEAIPPQETDERVTECTHNRAQTSLPLRTITEETRQDNSGATNREYVEDMADSLSLSDRQTLEQSDTVMNITRDPPADQH